MLHVKHGSRIAIIEHLRAGRRYAGIFGKRSTTIEKLHLEVFILRLTTVTLSGRVGNVCKEAKGYIATAFFWW
jgi:hypothetical protein